MPTEWSWPGPALHGQAETLQYTTVSLLGSGRTQPGHLAHRCRRFHCGPAPWKLLIQHWHGQDNGCCKLLGCAFPKSGHGPQQPVAHVGQIRGRKTKESYDFISSRGIQLRSPRMGRSGMVGRNTAQVEVPFPMNDLSEHWD